MDDCENEVSELVESSDHVLNDSPKFMHELDSLPYDVSMSIL